MNYTILFAATMSAILLIFRCDTNLQSANKNNLDKPFVANYKTNIQSSSAFDETMCNKGQSIYNAKCLSCHKVTNEKLVGPGLKGVTVRRTPEAIFKLITKVNLTLDSHLVADKSMNICLTQLPNQNLTSADARTVVEFMRKNDNKN